jgi:hypothetical protein
MRSQAMGIDATAITTSTSPRRENETDVLIRKK